MDMDMDTYNYVFYTIECLNDSVDFRYVGSTKNFKARKILHKSNCNNEKAKNYNSKIYTTIRANGGWANFVIIQIGTREQLTKKQATAIEENYRIELGGNLNSQRCYTTDEQKKEYYKDNKKKINEYYENNKEKNKERDKKYYEANKDKINEKKKERLPCECGCKVRFGDITRHKQSQKHINLIKNNIK